MLLGDAGEVLVGRKRERDGDPPQSLGLRTWLHLLPYVSGVTLCFLVLLQGDVVCLAWGRVCVHLSFRSGVLKFPLQPSCAHPASRNAW